MSLAAMKECWLPEFPAKCEGVAASTVIGVALALADIVNESHEHEFYGSVAKLATKARVERKVAGKVLAHLVAAGLLELIEERAGRTSRYRWMGVENVRQPDAPCPRVPSRDDSGPESSRRANQKRTASDTQLPLTGSRSSADEQALRRWGSVECSTCKAPAGEVCHDTDHWRSPLGFHAWRIAHAITTDWYDTVKERRGMRPSNFGKVLKLVQPIILVADHPRAILEALVTLTMSGRGITAESIEAEIAGTARRQGRRSPLASENVRFDEAGNLIPSDAALRSLT